MGEVVGFDNEQTIVMLMGFTQGIRRGDRVIGKQSAAVAPVGSDMLGRVVNALGEPATARADSGNHRPSASARPDRSARPRADR
jgi:flagellar biosynthesis/type III secretory pathway ATPase